VASRRDPLIEQAQPLRLDAADALRPIFSV
jgi:hypothetical protein